MPDVAYNFAGAGSFPMVVWMNEVAFGAKMMMMMIYAVAAGNAILVQKQRGNPHPAFVHSGCL
jgi:hypothetical protein